MNGVEATAGGTSRAWVRAHADVLTVARERAGLEGREGACLLRAFREDVHRHLGYGAFPEYADRYLGYGHRTTQDKLRTAEALEHLPELARALQEGQLHASAVRELTRVATRETEGDWIAAAAGRRMREIERLVAGRARGDRPSDAARRELERHVLRFEVSGETLAAFREVMAWLREQSGQALDDDAALLMLARSVLCGAGGEMQTTAPTATETTAEPAAASHPATGRSKYQIRLMVCERWGRGCQRLGADQIEVEPAMVDAARCDATVYNDPPANTDAHVDALDQPARAQTIASPHVSAPVASARAKATIPPAVRRRVLERDRQRCQIPGCRHTLDLDVHHILPRADGGTHDPRYLITLCGAHHRAVHAGRLQLSGAAGALCVRHADGSAYGAAIAPAAASNADIGEQVFRGLRGLGFKETEAKRALARAFAEHDHENPGDAEPMTAKALLQRALALLGPTRRRV